MNDRVKIPQKRLQTGVKNLDAILKGGLPSGAVVVLAGSPGSGKTILSHQVGFHFAQTGAKVVYFQTLSEPTAKRLKYLEQFDFYEPSKLTDGSIRFIDLGVLLKGDGLAPAIKLIMDHIKAERPNFVVIDSFKAFGDLTTSKEELRKFAYEIAVSLMAWECTAFLLGEFGDDDIQTNPLFSVVDGLIKVDQGESHGEPERFIQVIKMRGTDHSRRRNVFRIDSAGINLFTPRVTLRREVDGGEKPKDPARCQSGIPRLDEVLGGGIPLGSSVLVSGQSGTGKTAFLLEFIYKGAAQFGEKGVLFSFDETPARLLATAAGFGWDLAKELKKGNVEIVFVPLPDVSVEEHLQLIQETVERTGARRIALDSLSVFLDKSRSAQARREKVYQLATVVQMADAVGLFARTVAESPRSGKRQGVEETVADGVFDLASVASGDERQRYFEVLKLRGSLHALGRHSMEISKTGITIRPRGAKS